LQVVPQAPQLLGSTRSSTHAPLQQLPAGQAVPFNVPSFEKAVVLAAGSQLWQEFAGFFVPGASYVPPM
jgi:hypothetical protein